MLNADQLRAEADAHEARMKSPLWSEDEGDQDEDWMADMAPVSQETPRPQTVHRPDQGLDNEILPRLDALGRSMTALTEAVTRIRAERANPVADVPGWLQTAAGNPQTYDAPDPARESVCVRVLPTTYARLQQARDRLGLRTMAGTWECLLRLGLAAAERMPVL